MKRTNQSDCLLCSVNKATQRNSHIVPKFMGKTMLDTGKIRRGYLFNQSDLTNPEISQDTDKEDFILCPGCETYFSILESYIASNFHNKFRNPKFIAEFTSNAHNGINWKECERINPSVFRLFIYSIVWRCSISSTALWNQFKLDASEESTLKIILNTYRNITQPDCATLNIQQQEANIPFVFITDEEFTDKTGNLMFVNPSSKNPYHFGLNEYLLLISFDANANLSEFHFLTNIGLEKIKFAILSKELWSQLNEAIIKRVKG